MGGPKEYATFIFGRKKPDKKIIPKKIILHKKREKFPFEEEIQILLSLTQNRMFIENATHLEIKYVSEYLVLVKERNTPERFKEILDYAKSILQNMRNYFVYNAIESAENNTTWNHFENPYGKKKKIITKKKGENR